MSAQLLHIAAACPPVIDQAQLWEDWFVRDHPGPLAKRLWQASAVTTRHAVVDPRTEDICRWSTGTRMARYVEEALPLAKLAVGDALAASSVDAAAVDLFVVVSCTGYAAPGLDTLLARDLGMRDSVERLVVGHMGCYAAIPALAAVADAVIARGLRAVLLCVELPSLHVQAPRDGAAHVVAHALFSDAATAVVIAPFGPGLGVVDIAAQTDTEHDHAITWDITDLGFEMGLSPAVPGVLARHVRPFVDGLLARNGISREQVTGWAIHPGGPRILDVCAERLELSSALMAPSRAVLRDHGNCSSASVLFALDAVRANQPLRPGDHVVAMAFGPGLTLYAALLRQLG